MSAAHKCVSIAQHPNFSKQFAPRMAYTAQPQTLGEWEADGEALSAEDTSLQFRWGDWLNYGVKKWGVGRYEHAEAITGYSRKTLYNWAWVARNTPPHLRYPEVHYSAYKILASFASRPDVQQWYVEQYIENKWKVRDLEDALALSREGQAQQQTGQQQARAIVRDIETELARRGMGDDVMRAVAEEVAQRWAGYAETGTAHSEKVVCPYCGQSFNR